MSELKKQVTTTKFSNAVIASLIVEPLRYFFSNYTSQYGFTWTKDPKTSEIEIGYVSDFNRTTQTERPRILVDRGDYMMSKAAGSDGMMEMKTFGQTKGDVDKKSMVFAQGQCQITITARNQGTAEAIADLVSHFIVETRPTICNLGFKEFGLPMQVSRPQIDNTEGDTESFSIFIGFPWLREDVWKTWTESTTIKSIVWNVITN